MNGQESNHGLAGENNVTILTIHGLDGNNEQPTPVEVKVIRVDCPGKSDLPARLSRQRCGQKACQTAEFAPRQIALFNA
jgi:hypothetical protein